MVWPNGRKNREESNKTKPSKVESECWPTAWKDILENNLLLLFCIVSQCIIPKDAHGVAIMEAKQSNFFFFKKRFFYSVTGLAKTHVEWCKYMVETRVPGGKENVWVPKRNEDKKELRRGHLWETQTHQKQKNSVVLLHYICESLWSCGNPKCQGWPREPSKSPIENLCFGYPQVCNSHVRRHRDLCWTPTRFDLELDFLILYTWLVLSASNFLILYTWLVLFSFEPSPLLHPDLH